MRRRVGICGASEETLRLLALLVGNADVDVVRIYDPNPRAAASRARAVRPELGDFVAAIATDDFDAFVAGDALHAVVDDAPGGVSFAQRLPNAAARGIQVLTPLAARLLWAYGVAAHDRKSELLQALSEVVESVELTVDADELFTRMLEIAIGVTGADGGSLMLLDETARELRIRVAVGVERELWPKIRVPLGEGIAGRAAATARPLRIAGRADHADFHIVRERLDVESALCVPLVHEGRVLGVLNLHHSVRTGQFGEDDLAFVEQLAHLDAQIIARAREHEQLRDQASRYSAVRGIHRILQGPDPLPDRLRALCIDVAQRSGGGIANLYLREGGSTDLRLAATSLEGGGFGGEYRVVPGQGIDGRVAETGEARFLRDERGEIEYASLALASGTATIGVLSVQTGSGGLGRGAEGWLREIAAAAAEGIARVEREGRMSARANRLSAINETGMRMLAASEPNEVLRLATSSLALILDAEHAILRLQDDASKRFVIRSYFGAADGPQQERLFKLDKHVARETIRKRSAYRVLDTAAHPSLRGIAGDCRSLLAAPLAREGRVIGTLAVYDKLAADRFYPSRFDSDDLQVFAKYASYVERAIAAAQERASARQSRHSDPETGLPNETYLARRLGEEIARAEGRDAALALCICTIENLDEIHAAGGDALARRVVARVADALRRGVRDFDVVGRRSEAVFEILLPEPGSAPGDRVYTLARAVADAVAKDETLNRPVRVALGFGYAIHPYDGAQRDALVAAASPPRIRMV
ncbi:MAG: GAF domain-containing protein [Myxococcota bacterium]|nr:GAF domain-containing protein [Myxococcales bacterium]